MKNIRKILLIFFIEIIIFTRVNSDQDPIVRNAEECNKKSISKGFIKLAQRYGYKAEEHTIITDDGYIFKIFRIPESSLSPRFNGKPAVLLAHGLVSSSEIFGLFNRSLAYVLADAGFDVWLGNNRGNTYGRFHKHLSPEEPRFWNFSWHEIGKFDYASTIDYVLDITNKPNLTLIGYSMGGTASMVLLSERPEYNEKINVLINFAPALFIKNRDAMRAIFFNIVHQLKDFMDPYEMSELFAQRNWLIRLVYDICNGELINFCEYIFQLVTGHDSKLHNMKEILFSSNYFPSGSSTRCLWHYCQIVKTGEFRQYDYGTKNFQYYGEHKPPTYNLSNVQTNMVIFNSRNDYFCTDQDVRELNNEISSDAIIEPVNHPTFSHLDYAIAKNVKNLVFNRVVEFIHKYAY